MTYEQPPPGDQTPPPPPPKKKRHTKRWIALGIVGGLIAIGVAAGSPSDKPASSASVAHASKSDAGGPAAVAAWIDENDISATLQSSHDDMMSISRAASAEDVASVATACVQLLEDSSTLNDTLPTPDTQLTAAMMDVANAEHQVAAACISQDYTTAVKYVHELSDALAAGTARITALTP